MPKPKDAVHLCMEVEEFKQDNALEPHYGQNVYHVKCPNCIPKGKKTQKVSSDIYLFTAIPN